MTVGQPSGMNQLAQATQNDGFTAAAQTFGAV